MSGTIITTDRSTATDTVRVHTYTAPQDSFSVTTHIIETAQRLVVIDAQFVVAYADEAAQFATTLGKPIDRLIITHAHPDHYLGAARFGAPVHALPVVRAQIAATGDRSDLTGVPVRTIDVTPTVDVLPGREVIDGIPFIFDARSGGEASDELVIALPDQKIVVAQDLIYEGIHLFLGNGDIAGWQREAQRLLSAEYEVVLPGHGRPGGPELISNVLAYLRDAEELLGDDGEAYKRAVIERHPQLGGAKIIDIANGYLFGHGH